MTPPLSVNVFTAPEKAVVGERPRPFGPPMAWDPVTSTLIFGENDAVLVDTLTTVAEAEAHPPGTAQSGGCACCGNVGATQHCLPGHRAARADEGSHGTGPGKQRALAGRLDHRRGGLHRCTLPTVGERSRPAGPSDIADRRGRRLHCTTWADPTDGSTGPPSAWRHHPDQRAPRWK
jgi:hypothetical protein